MIYIVRILSIRVSNFPLEFFPTEIIFRHGNFRLKLEMSENFPLKKFSRIFSVKTETKPSVGTLLSNLLIVNLINDRCSLHMPSPICVKQFYILCALELQAHLFYIMVLKTFCNSYKLKRLWTLFQVTLN